MVLRASLTLGPAPRGALLAGVCLTLEVYHTVVISCQAQSEKVNGFSTWVRRACAVLVPCPGMWGVLPSGIINTMIYSHCDVCCDPWQGVRTLSPPRGGLPPSPLPGLSRFVAARSRSRSAALRSRGSPPGGPAWSSQIASRCSGPGDVAVQGPGTGCPPGLYMTSFCPGLRGAGYGGESMGWMSYMYMNHKAKYPYPWHISAFSDPGVNPSTFQES